MKFTLPDASGCWQEVTLREDDRGNIIVDMQSFEDVTPLIEHNKAVQNSGQKQYLRDGKETSMYKLGSLSALQAHMLIQQGIFQDDNALRRWFNDLDNYLWRVVDKRRRGGQQKQEKYALQNSQTAG